MDETKKKAPAPRKKTPAVRKTEPRPRRRASQNEPTPPKLKLLITIVNRQRAELYAALLQSFEVNMQMYLLAQGTASSEMLEYLGLSDSNKSVLLSVIREDKCDAALKFLDEKFHTIKNGRGIAFTVPLTSVIGVAIYQFLSSASEVKR